MSRALQAGLTSFATVALLSAASFQPAAARIRCDGDFQITQYGPIATPYCQDQEIASALFDQNASYPAAAK
jgi:hypothetical protein